MARIKARIALETMPHLLQLPEFQTSGYSVSLRSPANQPQTPASHQRVKPVAAITITTPTTPGCRLTPRDINIITGLTSLLPQATLVSVQAGKNKTLSDSEIQEGLKQGFLV